MQSQMEQQQKGQPFVIFRQNVNSNIRQHIGVNHSVTRGANMNCNLRFALIYRISYKTYNILSVLFSFFLFASSMIP